MSDSQAMYLHGSPAADARSLQIASAPSRPPNMPVWTVLVVKTRHGPPWPHFVAATGRHVPLTHCSLPAQRRQHASLAMQRPWHRFWPGAQRQRPRWHRWFPRQSAWRQHAFFETHRFPHRFRFLGQRQRPLRQVAPPQQLRPRSGKQRSLSPRQIPAAGAVAGTAAVTSAATADVSVCLRENPFANILMKLSNRAPST